MAPNTRLAQVQSHLGSARTMSMSATRGAASGSSGSPTQKRTGGGDAGDEPKVLSYHGGNTTTILLNRPKALNALDAEMVQLIDDSIEASPPHTLLVLQGKGRALCSGGDVMAVVKAANSDDPKVRQQALTFFKAEFELDYRIATLDKGPKPRTYVSVMDGITMGGGVGLSLHAPIRIATEKTLFAMPETGIGYWPDVGVTRHLSRLDGRVGQYLGMTGARISGEEAYLAGLATHFIPSSSIENALHRLEALPPNSRAEQVSGALDEFTVDPFNASANAKGPEIVSKTSLLGARRTALDYVFGQTTASAVYFSLKDLSSESKDSPTARALEKLGAVPGDASVSSWATETLKTLDAKSPRSLQVTLMAINQVRGLSEADAFRFDMRTATAFCDLSIGRDFYEGVMHTLTKDPNTGKRREGAANWNPKTLDEVDVDRVRALFFGPVEEAKKLGMQVDVPVLERVAQSSDRASRGRSSQQPEGVGPSLWEPSYNSFALPSEAEMDALREGSHPAAGNYQLQPEEMIQILEKVKEHKQGVSFKVKEWIQRRGVKGPD